MSRILVVDDDHASCRTLQLHLTSQGHDVGLAHTFDQGLAAARATRPELVILDIRMPGKSGLEGLPELKAEFPDTPVIVITAFHDMDATVQTMKRGADDYIEKPLDIDELDAAVAAALARAHPSKGEISFGHCGGRPGVNVMVGRSRAMKEVFKFIGLVAPNPATILVTGESGTGKELVARAMHRAGEHPDGPFVAVNCAALVDTLLESDLFGHEKGAFTGAISRHPGKFAMARNGTIFLDEVSELSIGIQAKLLRVLQEKEFIPVGGSKVQQAACRIIAATNVELAQRVEDGRFREDLYYRLQVVTVTIPPLRRRKEDLDELVPTLLTRINRDLHRNVSRVAAEVMEGFRLYDWPGNVRELENVLMKAVALCPGDSITPDLVSSAVRTSLHGNDRQPRPVTELSLDDVQREHVSRVLAATGWHRGRACEILEISRPRLRRYINQYGLREPVTDTDAAAPEDGM